MPAAATLVMRGLTERDGRASCNRSLRCSLRENGRMSGIRRHGVERDMEDRFLARSKARGCGQTAPIDVNRNKSQALPVLV